MNLIAVNINTLRLGQPLPFALRNEQGVLLAHKGYVISEREEITYWTSRGMTLCVDVDAADNHRAYVGKLYEMVRSDSTLGDIADMQLGAADLAQGEAREASAIPDWTALQIRANGLLRDPQNEQFLPRLERLYSELQDLVEHHPDATLCALMHLSATEMRMYSATHAMLVYVVCSLAAREVLNWPSDLDATLGRAALTMNIAMTAMQDELTVQNQALTAKQIEMVEQHAQRAFNMLVAMGVDDEDWLLAVRHHHDRVPGPLGEKTLALRLARLIQRADTFIARLSPRAGRLSMPPNAAMQACYFDEKKHVDEAGAALIKAVGVYSPGVYVRLANGEIAVVIRRSANTTAPRVAVVINRDGMPMGEMAVRETNTPATKIIAHVPHREVKVQVQLEKLLALI
ncbi:HD-GYP domain-containing protein [Rhodoferax sp.]|uniref:HD-GYP domain-containing protein n=1 Tax=Rhodoferax sp. TaxID=50421 RepID=UPI00374CF409